MARTIAINVAMSVTDSANAGDVHTIGPIRLSITQSGSGQDDRKHTIGTTEESITFTDIATNGMVFLHNLDTTNYVQWGFSTGVYGGRLKAGHTAGPFQMEPGATLYLKANTASCRVRISHDEA
jgi:hypothetical protein